MSWFSSKESDTKLRLDGLDEKTKTLEAALDDKTKELEEKIKACEKQNMKEVMVLIDTIRKETQEKLTQLEEKYSISNVKTVLYYDGSLYQGRMENNLPHGFGVIVHGNGVRYTGYWKNGLYEGSGVLFYPGMPPWNAEWKSHVPHGRCTYDFINFTDYVDGVLQ